MGTTSLRGLLVLALVAAISGLAAGARAQTTPSSGQQEQPGAPPLIATWQDGFVLQTLNGDYRLQLGMTTQADGRFPLDEPSAVIRTFTLRKLRPTFSGRIARYFDFKVMPDLASGAALIQDAYFDIRFSRALRLRFGKDKVPVGYELLQGDPYLLFPERALASSLVPNRDVGIQVQGDLDGNRLSYAAGVFNGIPDGSSSTTDIDTNNGKDLAGRLVWQPFKSAVATDALSGLGFHLGGSAGRETGALPAFKTSVGQTYFSFSNTAAANGPHRRVSPAVFYYYGPFGAFAEYMRSTQRAAGAGTQVEIANRGWETTWSLVLTGERASDRGVKPKHNFDPTTGGWGALQLAARYSRLAIDDAAFVSGVAAPTAAREARSVAVAANWYPTSFIKYYVTFERTSFDGTVQRSAEHVIVLRAQLAF